MNRDPFPEAFAAIERAEAFLSDNEADVAGWQNGDRRYDQVGDELFALIDELEVALAPVAERLAATPRSLRDRRRAETLVTELHERFFGWENSFATGITLGEFVEGPEQAFALEEILGEE